MGSCSIFLLFLSAIVDSKSIEDDQVFDSPSYESVGAIAELKEEVELERSRRYSVVFPDIVEPYDTPNEDYGLFIHKRGFIDAFFAQWVDMVNVLCVDKVTFFLP